MAFILHVAQSMFFYTALPFKSTVLCIFCVCVCVFSKCVLCVFQVCTVHVPAGLLCVRACTRVCMCCWVSYVHMLVCERRWIYFSCACLCLCLTSRTFFPLFFLSFFFLEIPTAVWRRRTSVPSASIILFEQTPWQVSLAIRVSVIMCSFLMSLSRCTDYPALCVVLMMMMMHLLLLWTPIWNSLPQDLRHCSTLSSFKAKLKTFLFSQYFHPNISTQFLLVIVRVRMCL